MEPYRGRNVMTTMLVEKKAKLTAQGQTTVPAYIREQLGVEPGDHLTFAVDAAGTVTLRRAEDDPAIGAFVDFLAEDIRRNPSGVRPVTASLERRLRRLAGATVIDKENDRIVVGVGL
jgi:antitoxin PrlF